MIFEEDKKTTANYKYKHTHVLYIHINELHHHSSSCFAFVQNNRPTIYLATPIEGIWPKTWKCKKKKWCIHWLSIYLESTKNWSYLWQNNVTVMNLIMQQNKAVIIFNIILRI